MQMINNKKTKSSEEKGITLIVLVITIIIILILAGISINRAFKNNGMMSIVGDAKEAQEIAELKDLISMQVLAYERRRMDPDMTFEKNFQKFKNDLIALGVINSLQDVSDRIDGVVTIVSNTKDKTYRFEVLFKTDENGEPTDSMADCIYDDQKSLTVSIVPTTNSIKVNVRRPKSETVKYTFKYSIKDSGANDSTYSSETKSEYTHEFTNLVKNKEYTVMVEQLYTTEPIQPVVRNVVTTEITESNIVELKNIVWKDGKATATFTKLTSEKIEYSIDNLNWTPVTMTEFTASNLTRGTIVQIRKKGSNEVVNIPISDSNNPKISGTNSCRDAWTNGSVVISANASDKNGIAKIEYYYGSSASNKQLLSNGPSGSKEITVLNNQMINEEVFVIATDNSGNESDPLSLGRVQIDKKAPVVQIGGLPTGTVEPFEEINVQLTFTEEGSGIDFSKTRYKWSASNMQDTNYASYKGVSEHLEHANIQEITIPTILGNNYLHILAVDRLGNKAVVVSPRTVSVKEGGGINGVKWKKINLIAKDISNDSSINNRTNSVTKQGITLNVGDTGSVFYNGVEKTVRILGFNHDELVNDDYGITTTHDVYDFNGTKVKTGVKTAGISFEFVDFLGSWGMNSSDTNSGGWGSSQMKTYLEGEVKNLSNSSHIKEVKKTYIPTYSSTGTSISNDKLWLLSCSEVLKDGYNGGRGYATTTEGPQYAYYVKCTDPFDMDSNYKKKPNISSASWWWLRSPNFDFDYTFCAVYHDGSCNYYHASYTIGVAPGFSI